MKPFTIELSVRQFNLRVGLGLYVYMYIGRKNDVEYVLYVCMYIQYAWGEKPRILLYLTLPHYCDESDDDDWWWYGISYMDQDVLYVASSFGVGMIGFREENEKKKKNTNKQS